MITFRLDDRAALVTGPASGIGRRLAVGLAEAGADVGYVDRPDLALARWSPTSNGSGARRSHCRPTSPTPARSPKPWSAPRPRWGRCGSS
jgi:hypothetical protein